MTPIKLDPKLPLLSWASIIEDKARDQLLQTASMPFIRPHVAVMPDVHWGLGCSVGAVVPTRGAIIPACVGVDIGCGMIAAKTQLRREEIYGLPLRKLRELVEQRIPMSPGKYNTDQRFAEPTASFIGELVAKPGATEANAIAPNWPFQLGSLGGGNHFIEFCYDREDWIWIFLHSGSRGVGNKLAQKHIKIASRLCQKWWISLPNPDLAYLVEGTDEFWAYMRDLRWAQHFALLNREDMLHRCYSALSEWYGRDVQLTETIRCHHNYTEEMPAELASRFRLSTKRDGSGSVWLTRKGAIDASAGKLGLIPGSMGARSYIVHGKGNPVSLWSAPHGAGRMYGRRQAQSTFTQQSLAQAMHNIEWSSDISDKLVDEHPAAYKSIDQVMHDANSLVEVENVLTQFVNIKGE